ncbi:MAG: LPS export ABC transporter periplasmic protein LptC [Bacteroidales bacterium]|nr:LPS export ABC transporter periplasmic protein LptC [Bacteroidales bacterium]
MNKILLFLIDKSLLFKSIVPVFLGMIFLFSCETDIEKINALTNIPQLADQTGIDVEVAYSDSGKLKSEFSTPELFKYSKAEEPYYEFPSGIFVKLYDNSEKLESTIEAKYAIYYFEKGLWEARNNVIAKNVQNGDRLDTEHLFWDTESRKIYSEKFSKIVNEDGVFYGENGFEADQDMTKWKLIGSKGTVTVKEDQGDS